MNLERSRLGTLGVCLALVCSSCFAFRSLPKGDPIDGFGTDGGVVDLDGPSSEDADAGRSVPPPDGGTTARGPLTLLYEREGEIQSIRPAGGPLAGEFLGLGRSGLEETTELFRLEPDRGELLEDPRGFPEATTAGTITAVAYAQWGILPQILVAGTNAIVRLKWASGGTFTASLVETAADVDMSFGIEPAYLDDDDLPDLVSDGDAGLSILYGNHESFEPEVHGLKWDTGETGTRLNIFHLADLDRDGDIDIIAGSSTGPLALYCSFNKGRRMFSDIRTCASWTAGHPSQFATGDLNDDGCTDIALALDDASVTMMFNDGEGTFGVSSLIYSAGATTTRPAPLIVDVDSDGDSDVLWAVDNSRVGVLSSEAQEFRATATLTIPGGRIQQLLRADADFDGRPDILIVTNRSIYKLNSPIE